jgi:cobalt-zinc-cadmium efflux system outer membrane protein
MRKPPWAWLGLLVLFGCVPTEVDYSELKSAADARHWRAETRAGALPKDVNVLLGRPLTADSAAQVALLNNRGLRASIETLAIAQAELTGARRLPNPTLEAAMRFHGDERPELEVGAMIDLTELLLVLARGGAAEAGVAAAKLAAVGAVLDLSFQARQAFFEYQAARQTLGLRRTVMQAFAASADVAERLREAGNITELERANQQSALEEARLNFRRAETIAATARERLNSVMGLWGRGIEWRALERLPELPERELPIDSIETEAVRRSLDLELAKQRFTAAAKTANIARAGGWLPELKAGVSAERDAEWAVGPAVELELPLFYQGQAEVAVAKAEMRQQQNRYTDTAVRLRARARELASRLRASREAVLYYRDVLLPLKQKVLDETQLQFNAMAVGIFQLLQAKREQVETASGFIDELREYWLLRTQTEQLLAGRFGEAAPAADFIRAASESAGTGAPAH